MRLRASNALLGAKLVWIETLAELKNAINPRTAMLFFLNRYEPLGQINRQDWVQCQKPGTHSVPVFNDAAADVPPAGRLSEYVNQGFDLVVHSPVARACEFARKRRACCWAAPT